MNPQDLTLERAAEIVRESPKDKVERIDNLFAEYVRKQEEMAPKIVRPGELVRLNLIVFKANQQLTAPPYEMLIAVKAYDPTETWFRFCMENPGVVALPVKVIADLMLRNITVIRYGMWLKEKGYCGSPIRGLNQIVPKHLRDIEASL